MLFCGETEVLFLDIFSGHPPFGQVTSATPQVGLPDAFEGERETMREREREKREKRERNERERERARILCCAVRQKSSF